ncbi:MAG: hypothetical protein ACTFAL_16590 [Candidatus Electronema sp. V4]|uniref:hypothetical protein n=1 Tax=Candidatus Electronema sp. V4 TaxID=3454756 RepID=UPI0040554F52
MIEGSLTQILLIPSLSTLIGALVAYLLGVRSSSIGRRAAYIERQLSEFYSPLAAYQMRIKSKLELRSRVSELADQCWQEIEQTKRPFHDHKERFFSSHQKQIEYDWQQFREELIPLYRKMLEVFTDKYWLADPDTRQYYQTYLDHVELWERHLSGSLPFEVSKMIRREQDKLESFYEHLEERMEKLRQELKDEKFFRYR